MKQVYTLVNLDGIAAYDVLSPFEPVDLLCPTAGSTGKSDAQQEQTLKVEKLLMSVTNLNLSLTHVQKASMKSWQARRRQQFMLYLRGDDKVRQPHLLSITSTISFGIGDEKRSGDMMASIHGIRLSLLLTILELAWFSAKDNADETKSSFAMFITSSSTLNKAQRQPARFWENYMAT